MAPPGQIFGLPTSPAAPAAWGQAFANPSSVFGAWMMPGATFYAPAHTALPIFNVPGVPWFSFGRSPESLPILTGEASPVPAGVPAGLGAGEMPLDSQIRACYALLYWAQGNFAVRQFAYDQIVNLAGLMTGPAQRSADLEGVSSFRALAGEQMTRHGYGMRAATLGQILDDHSLRSGLMIQTGAILVAAATGGPGSAVIGGVGSLGGAGGGDDDLLSKPIRGHVAECLRMANIEISDKGFIELLEGNATEGMTVGEVLSLIEQAMPIFVRFPNHVPFRMQIVGRIVTGSYARGAIGDLVQISETWDIGKMGHPVIVERDGLSFVEGVNMPPIEIADIVLMLLPEGIGDQSLSVLMGSLAETRPRLTFREAATELAPVALALKNKYERARQIILYDYFQGRRSAKELSELAMAMESGHFRIWYLDDGQHFEPRDRWLEWAENIRSNQHMFSQKWIADADAYVSLDAAARARVTEPPVFALTMDNYRPAVFAGSRNHLGTMIHEANMPVDVDNFYRVAGMKAYLIVEINEIPGITSISLRPDGGSVPNTVTFNAPAFDVQIAERPPFVEGDRVFIIPGAVEN